MPPTRNKTIATAATEDEKRAFEQFCRSKNMRPAAMLRLMLAKVCPGVIEPGDAIGKERKSAHLFLSLTTDEEQQIRERARKEGTTRQGWVRKLVRAALHRKPQFNAAEANALRESNRELAAIGRNINQIAYAMNGSPHALDQWNAQRLAELEQKLRQHREKVTTLINANWGRVGDDEA